jgi:membrane-bound metal-dependent hydrolase YbcI (DUF457 family)
MNAEMALLGEFLWAAAMLLGLVIIGGTVVATVGFVKAPDALSTLGLALIRSHGITQTIISMIIIGAIIALRFLDKISAEATIGVLGAIMGYVLKDATTYLDRTVCPLVEPRPDTPP